MLHRTVVSRSREERMSDYIIVEKTQGVAIPNPWRQPSPLGAADAKG